MRVGVLGGGQLGLMLAEAVGHLGHSVRVLEPDAQAPCALRLASVQRGALDDPEALAAFFAEVDVATVDSENIEVGPLARYAAKLRPSLEVLRITQHRIEEKRFLLGNGFSPVEHVCVPPHGDVRSAARAFGLPCIVKTARLGYDGKGQARVTTEAELEALALDGQHGYVIEELIALEAELSCIVASDGTVAHAFPVFENHHRHHILDCTVVPARLPALVQLEARERALAIAQRLGVVGLLTVELFFGRGRDGVPKLFVNELAPRVHNSGHVTRRACSPSQFDALARILVEAPLTAPRLRPGSFAMGQLLGELWLAQGRAGGELGLSALQRVDGVEELYLYGKAEARPGRKMGHFVLHAATSDEAVEKVATFQQHLRHS